MKCLWKKPTLSEQKIIRREVSKVVDKHINEFNLLANLHALYTLHFVFGFGMKRLNLYLESVNELQRDALERYDASDSDLAFIFKKKLIDDGIDVDKLLSGENNGN